MRIEKICLNCDIVFYAKSEKHIYCCRKCFKQAYFRRKKKEEINSYPIYCCAACGYKHKLDFHPTKKKNRTKWSKYPCPRCQTTVLENMKIL